MDYTDERYVRLYTRDTATWKLLNWQAKCLLPLLLRKCDRAGVIEFGSADMAQAVTALLDVPIDLVKPGLQSLAEREVIELRDRWLVFPHFIDAQEAKTNDKRRAAEYRGRRRDRARRSALAAGTVTPRDESSRHVTIDELGDDDHTVTPRDESSRHVTIDELGDDDHTVTPRDESSRHVTAASVGAAARVTPRDEIPQNRHTASHGVTPSRAELYKLDPSTEVVADLSGSARAASSPTPTPTDPQTPPVRPKDLFPEPIRISDYEPLPEHMDFAAALGLDAYALAETVAEVRQREFQRRPNSPYALADYLDTRLNAFIRERGAQLARPRPGVLAASRTPALQPQSNDVTLDDIDDETRAAIAGWLEGDP